MKTKPQQYNGWEYNYDDSRPASGPWRATRFGVGLNHISEEGLKRMIDQKNKENATWRKT